VNAREIKECTSTMITAEPTLFFLLAVKISRYSLKIGHPELMELSAHITQLPQI
jgi:hypothetical protein